VHSSEAIVLVNGVLLTEGQALSLRMAVTMFLGELDDPTRYDVGDVQVGNYRARLREILALMRRNTLQEPSQPRT
jgi:hypothetical protein